MSAQHGGKAALKPIGEIAKYLKNLMPANIPDDYAVNPSFVSIASEGDIQRGVAAFRDFLYLFCDRLDSDGHLYAKPPKTPKAMDDYPFLHNINNFLIEMGYHGKLAESGDSLLITEMPSFSGNKPKVSASSQSDCKRFLTLCGFVFDGSEVLYPNNPIVVTGLKAIAVAEMDIRRKRYWNDLAFLRCDYRLIKKEKTDPLDILKDFVHPLPEKVQNFAVNLHQRYRDMGVTCVIFNGNIAYAYTKNSKEVASCCLNGVLQHETPAKKALSQRKIYDRRLWEFSCTLRNGFALVARPKKTEKYTDIIETFPPNLREKIERGYGCDRLRRNEPCQHGCAGIIFPLDASILDIGKDIEKWLDNEVKK
jgi:hypothetical protein